MDAIAPKHILYRHLRNFKNIELIKTVSMLQANVCSVSLGTISPQNDMHMYIQFR
jgi:hypothetical protein